MGERGKKSPGKKKFTASEINRLNSKAKRKHQSNSGNEVAEERRGGRPTGSGERPGQPSWVPLGCQGAKEGPVFRGCPARPSSPALLAAVPGGLCLKIPPLIFFLLIFFIFYFWTDSQIKEFRTTEHQPLHFS
jgi:hypothetical protein